MSFYKYTDPVCKNKDDLHGDTYEHPAFAQIGASRVSGGATLYGSDFQHQHFVTITIYRSELKRNLSMDWHYGHDELISVALSEAQWAAFVSSMNVGTGVCCTLQHVGGERVEQLKPPQKRNDQFKQEMADGMKKSAEMCDKLREALAQSGMSQKKQWDMQRMLDAIQAGIGGSANFIADQFGEHMEHVTERAKTEVNAYALRTLMGLGADAMKGLMQDAQNKLEDQTNA